MLIADAAHIYPASWHFLVGAIECEGIWFDSLDTLELGLTETMLCDTKLEI